MVTYSKATESWFKLVLTKIRLSKSFIKNPSQFPRGALILCKWSKWTATALITQLFGNTFTFLLSSVRILSLKYRKSKLSQGKMLLVKYGSPNTIFTLSRSMLFKSSACSSIWALPILLYVINSCKTLRESKLVSKKYNCLAPNFAATNP